MKKTIFLSVIVLIFSCSKENKTMNETKIIEFKNIQEYQEKSKFVASLSVDELIAYEDSKGYQSIARLSEELFMNLDTNYTKEQMDSLVKANLDIITYSKDEETNEEQIDTKYNFTFMKYFITKENQFVKIENTVYKILSNSIVSTDYKNLNALKNINDNNVLNINDDKIKVFNKDLQLKCSSCCNMSYRNTGPSHRIGNIFQGGLFRVMMFHEINFIHGWFYETPFTSVEMFYQIESQRLVGGFWVKRARRLGGNIDITYRVKNPNTNLWEERNFTKFISTGRSEMAELKEVFFDAPYLSWGYHTQDFNFVSFDSYAVSEEVPNNKAAILKCNR
jgi:hypothetical protein